jgi:hypothetical protein
MSRRKASLSHLILLAILLPAALASQTPPNTPVGHWLVEQTSKGGLGSWWDFRPDGTFTRYVGAAVTVHIKRSHDTLTLPAPSAHTAPIRFSVQITGDTLYLKSATSQQTYTRVGPAPSPADPLLGRWKLVPDPSAGQSPTEVTQQANALYVFSADGTESARIPFDSMDGTWNATTHTFRFNDRTIDYTFQRIGSKLILGHPPDNTDNTVHSVAFVPDPIL